MTTKKIKQHIKAVEAKIQKLRELDYDLRKEWLELQHKLDFARARKDLKPLKY